MSETWALVRKHRSLLLILLIAAQILFLAGMAFSHYRVLWYGKEVGILTVPIDPRDLLFGDYVTLRYEINSLKPELWKDSATYPHRGEPVYVVLKSGGAYESFVPIAAYGSKPAIREGEVLIKGRVTSSSNNGDIWADYGLEKYYVSEGTGKKLEKQASHLLVKVKVSGNGNAVLSSLKAVQ